VALGRHLGLADEELWALYNGGYLHDLGKIATPDAILLKAGPLTAAEEAQMREHTVVGDRLCSELRAFQRVRPIVRHHHERLDGSGYPDGLAGSHVPLLAQIVSIVDAFDALTTDRPYRPAQPAEVALALLDDEVRLGWRDRTLVGAFTSLVGAGGISAADSTAPRRLWPVREEAP
jgi:putative two-component system response regulator